MGSSKFHERGFPLPLFFSFRPLGTRPKTYRHNFGRLSSGGRAGGSSHTLRMTFPSYRDQRYRLDPIAIGPVYLSVLDKHGPLCGSLYDGWSPMSTRRHRIHTTAHETWVNVLPKAVSCQQLYQMSASQDSRGGTGWDGASRETVRPLTWQR